MAKLMLVEDDNNLREIYQARLQAEGYEIVAAKDGEEALVIAKAEKPELIISDVMMPKISGFEMLDILRNTEGLQDVKVIMLTALGQNDDQQRADKLGANRYLVKSQVTLEDIVKVAHELLGDATPPAATMAADSPAPATSDSATPSDTPATSADSSTVAAAQPAPVAADPVAAEPAAPAPTPVATDTVVDTPAAPAATVAEPATSEPAAEASSAAPAPEENAQSTSQEEASVEAKIEDFVAGATEEPTAPMQAEPVLTTPEEPAEPEITTPETAPADPVAAYPAASPAIDTAQSAAADQPVMVEPSLLPAEQPATPEAAESPPTQETEEAPKTGGERVIQPIDTAPKTDINVLVAEEAAKEAETTAPTPVVGDNAKPAAGDKPQIDPNSIAL